MIRGWAWIGAAVGVAGGLLALTASGALADLLTGLGLASTWTDLLIDDGVARVALATSVFGLLWVLVGHVLPAVLLCGALHRAAERAGAISDGGAPTRTAALAPLRASAWTASAVGPLKRQLVLAASEDPPAERPVLGLGDSSLAFHRAGLVDQPLAAGLFRAVPGALVGFGLLLLLFALANGVNGQTLDALQASSRGSLGLLIGLRSGFSALLLCGCAALLCWLGVRLAGAAADGRRVALARAYHSALRPANFAQMASALASMSERHVGALATAVETTALGLREQFMPALEAMQRSADQLAANHGAATETVIRAAMQSFVRDLAEVHGDQFKQLSQATDKLRKTVETATSLVKSADAAAAQKFSAAADGIRAAAVAQAEGAYVSFQTLVGETVGAIQETSQSGLAATRQLLDALARETDGARTIQQSAAEISAAARASRETVERFIALAERMRELHQAISAAPVVVQAEPPLANPETTRRLSSAIQTLRRHATETLPEL